MVGTVDITDNYLDSRELDFNRRLIAKFKIFRSNDFWGERKTTVKDFMVSDEINDLCIEVRQQIKEENNIQAMFPALWRNDFVLYDETQGWEFVEIKNGNEFYGLGRLLFYIDSVAIDKVKGVIKFRKVGVDDNRGLVCTLQIINPELYQGTESNESKTTYKRLE